MSLIHNILNKNLIEAQTDLESKMADRILAVLSEQFEEISESFFDNAVVADESDDELDEDQLDELYSKTLSNYIVKAVKDKEASRQEFNKISKQKFKRPSALYKDELESDENFENRKKRVVALNNSRTRRSQELSNTIKKRSTGLSMAARTLNRRDESVNEGKIEDFVSSYQKNNGGKRFDRKALIKKKIAANLAAKKAAIKK